MRLRFARSIYIRTVVQLTMAILVVFLVLGLVYYTIVSQTSIKQQRDQLQGAAQAIAVTIGTSLDKDGMINNPQVNSYVNFTARSTGALVWIINHRGEIVLQTGVPATVMQELGRSERGYYQLDDSHLVAKYGGTSGISIDGDFGGMFKESGGHWLSTAYQVPSGSAGYRGEIQLHLQQSRRTFMAFLMTNGLVASFLVAFAIALLINGILSRNITRPLRLLAETVEKVARGDLSARVPVSSGEEGGRSSLLARDDLSTLMRTMNDMIEKMANQEKDRKDFISSVSHDLRTPITSIRGFIEGMLDDTIPQERYSHYLGIVKQEVLRLQTLVNTMFEGSVLESDRQLDRTVFDINRVIREDIIGLETLLAAKDLDVQTDFLADDEGLMVIGDREAISRVVYNILSNAVRYTPQDGIIALATRRSKRSKEIEVVIEDSGPGIPEDEYPFVFDRFYKLDKSRSAHGSGLGLYICRTILAAHGQRIHVARSDLGGARFIFTLQEA